jgi:hypothetical protein
VPADRRGPSSAREVALGAVSRLASRSAAETGRMGALLAALPQSVLEAA